jgi:alpha/beta superfamily hydrolase
MTRFRLIQYPLVLSMCLLGTILNAAVWDTGRERAIADKLSAELQFGELVWLQTDKQTEFPVIYTQPENNNKRRAVILLHSMSAHMDWPVVIAPLRASFRNKMWSSLSIQLPVMANEKSPAEYGKTLDEASRRISSAIRFLVDQDHGIIVVVGYGFGATTAAHFLAGDQTKKVQAFVGISMFIRKYLAPQVNLHTYLEELYLPTLDIYGSNDLQAVIQTADDRRLFSSKNGNNFFSQIIIEGADHNYTKYEQTLFNRIINWLDKLNPEVAVKHDYGNSR